MTPGSILSGIFHFALALLVVFGLPAFIRPPPEPEPPNTVEVVMLAPKATAPELTKPPVPKQPDPPKPEARPEPTPPAPTPPKAAEARPEPKPEPKPELKPEPKPEPIPEKKAEVIKPEKKEEPKKEEPKKAEVKKEPPKKEPDRFDSILKNLDRQRAPHKPDAKPVQQAAAPQPTQTAPNLSQQLARSEMDAVRDKVRPCWNFPVGAPNPERLIVDIQVSMNPNGTVREATIVDRSRMNDPFYRSAAEAALRATLNPSCQPFPLPPEKYSTWRSFTFGFDPRDL
ncbi:MAG: TonB C-terminal domain-containing protein [Reyranellaceae bacterium]